MHKVEKWWCWWLFPIVIMSVCEAELKFTLQYSVTFTFSDTLSSDLHIMSCSFVFHISTHAQYVKQCMLIFCVLNVSMYAIPHVISIIISYCMKVFVPVWFWILPRAHYFQNVELTLLSIYTFPSTQIIWSFSRQI